MQIDDFMKKIEENSFIDPEALSKLMELILDMPLDKMYSDKMNYVPHTQIFDPYAQYILNIMMLEDLNADEVTFKEMIDRTYYLMRSGVDDFLCYKLVAGNIANWSAFFVPNFYNA